MALTKVTYSMIEGGFINPTDYGVTGDGTTDDAAAMQLAINAAVDTQTPLLLAPTTYNITASVLSATLSAGEKLIVVGNGAVFNTTIADAANFYDGFFTINGTATSEVVVSDFSISSNQSGAWSSTRLRGKMVGLAIKTMGNVQLTNVSVSGFGFINIWLYYADRGLVLDCQAINAAYAGLFMQSCEDINVYGGQYNQNGGDNSGVIEGYGVTCATNYQVSDRDNKRVKIDGITAIDNIGKGIDAHCCFQFTVTNNHIRGFGRDGIYAVHEGGSKNVSNVIISNNYVSGSGGTALNNTCSAIMVGATDAADVGSFVVSGNEIRSNVHGLGNSTGIFITNPSTGVLEGRVIVDGNTLDNAAADAASVSSIIRVNNNAVSWPEVIVTNNIIRQTLAVANGINLDKVEKAIISSNLINTSDTMINGIVTGAATTCTFGNNVLSGTFSSYTIAVYGSAYQVAYGNIVNGLPFRTYANTGAAVAWATAVPTTEYWYQGSVVWNKSATVGQPKGWQCTVSGTPGTWVSMGNL